MSTNVQDPAPAPPPSPLIEERLDELIPRPAPMWRRALGGGLLIGAIACVSLLWLNGYLVPRPFADTDFGGSSTFWDVGDLASVELTQSPGSQLSGADQAPVLMMRRTFRNLSSRTVRLTDISIDAFGVELLQSKARVQPPPDPGDCETSADGTTTVCSVSENAGYDPRVAPPDAQLLPLLIEPDVEVDFYVWLRPYGCPNPPPITYPWGDVTMTFDFGEGAFPPVARAVSLGDPLVRSADQARFQLVDGPSATATQSGPRDSVLDQLCRL